MVSALLRQLEGIIQFHVSDKIGDFAFDPFLVTAHRHHLHGDGHTMRKGVRIIKLRYQ